jgi:hypothetical protein
MIHHNLATSFSFQVRKLRYPLVFIYYATSSSIGGILTQSRSSIACLWRGAVGSDTSHEKGPEAREFEPRRRHLFQHPRKHPLSFPRVMFFGFLLVCWVWDCLFVFFFSGKCGSCVVSRERRWLFWTRGGLLRYLVYRERLLICWIICRIRSVWFVSIRRYVFIVLYHVLMA